MTTVHVADMIHISYQPPLAKDYTPSQQAEDCVPVDEARIHVLNLIDAGITREHLSALSGVRRPVIDRVIGLGRRDSQFRIVDRRVAAALLLVRHDLDALSPDTRVLAVGAQRRIQALARMGHPLTTIAAWLRVDAATLEALLAPTTRTVTVRAHRVISRVFTEHWAEKPERTDDATVDRAVQAGWQSPLAWDDIDLDLRPATVTLRTVEHATVDEVAVELALTGEHLHLHLGPLERRAVIEKAHARHLSDNAISALTDIPLTTVWKIRQELGLEAWFEPTREYEDA